MMRTTEIKKEQVIADAMEMIDHRKEVLTGMILQSITEQEIDLQKKIVIEIGREIGEDHEIEIEIGPEIDAEKTTQGSEIEMTGITKGQDINSSEILTALLIPYLLLLVQTHIVQTITM